MSGIIQPSRRGFLTGLGAAFITAPAIVRAGSLMQVRAIIEPVYEYGRSPMMEMLLDLEKISAKVREVMMIPPEWLVTE